eukprot:scaffold27385_cov37-Tisochrysis_lutea.AAC.1
MRRERKSASLEKRESEGGRSGTRVRQESRLSLSVQQQTVVAILWLARGKGVEGEKGESEKPSLLLLRSSSLVFVHVQERRR